MIFTRHRSMAVGSCAAGKEKAALGSIGVTGAVRSKRSGGESCKHFPVY